MDKLTDKQKAALGIALIVVPGAALALGTYLLYTGIKKALSKKTEVNNERRDQD
jgi:hypothetical protein